MGARAIRLAPIHVWRVASTNIGMQHAEFVNKGDPTSNPLTKGQKLAPLCIHLARERSIRP